MATASGEARHSIGYSRHHKPSTNCTPMISKSLLASLLLTVAPQCLLGATVQINGYVATLTGNPHKQPDITIEVRAIQSNTVIASAKANLDGSFSISVDPNRVPANNTTLSITASGTALLNGERVAVSTNGSLFGLAGKTAAKLEPNSPDDSSQIKYFFVLVVPQSATPAMKCVPRCQPISRCNCYHCRWRRHR